MSDPFSNWANKGWERVREVGHKVQSQFHLTPEDHHTQQQHHEHQLKVDRVELSKEGKLPQAKVSNSHLEFVANFNNEHSKGDSPRKTSSDRKSSGGSERRDSGKQEQRNHQEQSNHTEQRKAHQATNEATNQSRPQPAEHEVAGSKKGQTTVEAKNLGKSIPEETRRAWDEAILAYQEKYSSAHSVDNSKVIPSTGSNSRTHGYVELKNTPEHVKNAGKMPGANTHGSEHVELRNLPEHLKRGKSQATDHRATTKGLGEQAKSTAASKSELHNSTSHQSESPRHIESKETKSSKTNTQITGDKGPLSETKQSAHNSERGPKETNKGTAAEGPHSAKNPGVSAEVPKDSPLTPRVIGGRIAFGGLSVMGIVGGAYEIKDGIQQLKSGKHLEGTLNTTAGVSDITSGTASLLYTFGKEHLGNFAAKVGGIGSITSGLAEGIDGFKNKDDEKKFEGSLKVTLGAGMLFSSTAAISTSAALGWGVGRFAGRNVGWGGENVDTKVTRLADGLINSKVNAELAAIQHKESELSGKALELMGQDAQALNAKGISKKEATEAIIGLRSMLEQERNAGRDTQELQANLKMMLEVRAQLKS